MQPSHLGCLQYAFISMPNIMAALSEAVRCLLFLRHTGARQQEPPTCVSTSIGHMTLVSLQSLWERRIKFPEVV